ncbi:MAG TPA: alpha/beta hydrolase [Acidimicrobiales bacterium]|nr:alpha/beta hydrolase [Acidimicrobiales bacterium]
MERREVDGWELLEGGATERIRHRVLLLPANMATAEFYRGMLEDPALAHAGVQALAATPPGFGGRPAPVGFPFTVDAYAELVDEMARRESVDLLLGHSLSAHALIDVATYGRWRGALVLVAPALRPRDEEASSRSLDRVSRVPVMAGAAWWAMLRALDFGMRGQLPETRREALVAEMRRNPGRVHRRWLIAGFNHLTRHRDLTPAVVAAARPHPVALVRGTDDRVTLADDARVTLATAGVRIVEVADAGHFVVVQRPEAVNAVVLGTLERGVPT